MKTPLRWPMVAGLLLQIAVLAQTAGASPQQSGTLDERFARAEQVFNSAEQPSAIELFSQLIADLESPAPADVTDAGRALWARALSYRAQARFNIGDAEGARGDLERLLTSVPAATFDAGQLSPKFVDLADELRRRLVGRLELRREPLDAVIRIDGQPVAGDGSGLMMAAGPHVIEANRLGYAPFREEIEITGGATRSVDVVLARASAVVRLSTRPGDIRVRVDGKDAGTTSAGIADTGEMVLDGLLPGLHVIELEKDAYRTHRATLSIERLADYTIGTITMEKTAAAIVLRGLAPGETIDVDGAPVALTPAIDDSATPIAGAGMVQVPPGAHRIFVDGGRRGVFSADVTVIDRQRLELEARLRPGLAFMGVLGGDTFAASKLAESLRREIAAQDRWAWLDRSPDAATVLRRASLDQPGKWRASGASATVDGDLNTVQRQLRDTIPASLYVLAVLSDDLLATSADLWVWPSSSGPAIVDRLAVNLEQSKLSITALAAAGGLVGPWFGALLVDIESAAGPVVFDVTPDSPAAAAGLQPGDEVVEDAAPAADRARLRQRLARARPREGVTFQVRRGGTIRPVTVVMGETPMIVQPGPERPGAVIWAGLETLTDGVSPWVIELNRASILLNAGRWEDAVRLLRSLEIQQTQGVGQGTRDYWLGMALAALGPDYAELARAALTRAVQNLTARLEHNDGPLVWPLAQALLERLRR